MWTFNTKKGVLKVGNKEIYKRGEKRQKEEDPEDNFYIY